MTNSLTVTDRAVWSETFGFCFFQCLYLDALGRKMLITRAPDLRQAQHTSTIEDIRIWPDDASESAVHFLRRMLDDLGIRPTVTLNAKVCEDYPEVAGACLESGWEFNAHSYEQLPMHKLDDERSVIEHSLTVIENFTGSKPKGWFGPGLTQTYDTLDHLSHAGIEYIGDWVLDDQPIWARTEHQPIAALPYNYELHDIVMMNIQNNPSHIYRDRALDYFDTLYSESDDGNPRVIALAMHTYLSGSPHRISYVRETFETLMKKPDVVCWDGLQIYDWFTNQIPAPKN